MDKNKSAERRTVIAVRSFDEAEKMDRDYWWSRTPQERMAAMERLRQMNYDYDPVTDRIQRVLEIVERA